MFTNKQTKPRRRYEHGNITNTLQPHLHKYRPVILRLMMNAEDAPQQYVFSDHEFKRIFPKSRGGLDFILHIHRSRAVNNIKASPLADALLGILKESKTAIRLTEGSTYELILDENFVFHVRKSGVTTNQDATSAVSLDIGYF